MRLHWIGSTRDETRIEPSPSRTGAVLRLLQGLLIIQATILLFLLIRDRSLHAYFPRDQHLIGIHEIGQAGQETYCVWQDAHTRGQAQTFAAIMATSLEASGSWQNRVGDNINLVKDTWNGGEEYKLCDNYNAMALNQIIIQFKFVPNYPFSGSTSTTVDIGNGHNGMLDKKFAVIIFRSEYILDFTNPVYQHGTISHELGHAFGLTDLTNCDLDPARLQRLASKVTGTDRGRPLGQDDGRSA